MRAGCLVLLVLSCALAARAATAEPGQKVDVELVLSADSSGSIDMEEFALQRLGYARALTNPRVLEAIGSGPHRSVAITFVEWSGPGITTQVVGWTRIAGKADAETVAAQLIAEPRTIFGGGTSLGAAIVDAAARFDGNGFDGSRRVIDISGDGPNNRGSWPSAARAHVVAQGVTINGLPIVEYDEWLADYFRQHVVGGPGAFVIVAQGFEDFSRAVVKKLIRELFISDRRGGAGSAAAAAN